MNATTSIQTMTGQFLDFSHPEYYDYTIEEIAKALSRTPRFKGHTKRFYSVARHSIWVADNIPEELKLHGLLHDAHEAYIGDIATPLANYLGAAKIKSLKQGIQDAIYRDLEVPRPFGVDQMTIDLKDFEAMMVEKRDLLEHDLPWDIDIDVSAYPPISQKYSYCPENDYQLFVVKYWGFRDLMIQAKVDGGK
jgi:hypothetical protein